MPSFPSAVQWRRLLPVLVTDSQAMGSIAVIRSLGRAGYPVHACAADPEALGLLSHYAEARAIYPRQADQFIAWLREYVHKHRIRALVPSEAVLLALRPHFEEFAALLPFSQRPEILYPGLSKFDLFTKMKSSPEMTDHLPPTLLLSDTAQRPDAAALAGLGCPLYIKTDTVYALGPATGTTYRALSAEEAGTLLSSLSSQFSKATVQGHVPGRGVGVFFLLWNGQVIAQFMHRRLHEVPHTGGVSSLRESWWHAAIHRDALEKLQRLAWQGVAMMEYRWDPQSDRFYLMEMNGRFWGSLHLALYAGVDFPTLLLDCFNNHIPVSVHKSAPGLRSRHTFPLEAQYVASRLKDGNLPLLGRLWSLPEFLLLMLLPRVRSDLLFPGDRRLFWVNLRRFWVSLFS